MLCKNIYVYITDKIELCKVIIDKTLGLCNQNTIILLFKQILCEEFDSEFEKISTHFLY